MTRNATNQAASSGGGLFAPSVHLLRVAGVDVGVNWTWLVVFGLIVWSLAGAVFPADVPGRSAGAYLAMGVAAAAVFFASLVLHELGHAVQARRDGVRIEGITLWLFGGVARFAGELPSAGAEFRIAIAGPLVSLALGVLFLGVSAAWPQPGAVREVLLWLGYTNIVLLVFNMLPAIPLDGGRVLRSVLWWRSGNLRAATHRAARVSTVLAWMLIALGALELVNGAFQGIWLAVIGWFVFSAGRAEEDRVDVDAVLDPLEVRDLMTTAVVAVAPDWSLADFAQALAGTARHTAYPVIDDDVSSRSAHEVGDREAVHDSCGRKQIARGRPSRSGEETSAPRLLEQGPRTPCRSYLKWTRSSTP